LVVLPVEERAVLAEQWVYWWTSYLCCSSFFAAAPALVFIPCLHIKDVVIGLKVFELRILADLGGGESVGVRPSGDEIG
jgi:hypothetical protein